MRVGSDEVAEAVLRADRGDRHVVFVVVLVVDHRVAVREGATLYVLARYPDVVSLVYQRSKGQSLSSSPVDSLSLFDGFYTLLKDLLDLSVPLAFAGESGDRNSDLPELLRVESCCNGPATGHGVLPDVRPRIGNPILCVELVLF